MKDDVMPQFQSGQKTAKAAAAILVAKKSWIHHSYCKAKAESFGCVREA
jgi:hypothetical protein